THRDPRFESLWGYASLAQSAERDRDMVEAAGAEPAGRTSYLETVLVNGEATGAPDKRVAGGAVPPTRPKHDDKRRLFADAKPQTRMERERTFNPSACGS